VTLWGTGTPTREFLHVDDMARASLFVLDLPRDDYDAVMAGGISHINVGSGDEISIRELATMIADVVGFKGKIVQDLSKPDGTPRKVMDSSLLASLGWRPDIGLKDGLAESYRWFLENAA
ncbi:MAG: NAD-dependent epimerase/dehydratase family protein, partial [Silicimonas sp.]|nr:NAD-dependent epimerase/dehydratase family protein [Silicimonas sp.]